MVVPARGISVSAGRELDIFQVAVLDTRAAQLLYLNSASTLPCCPAAVRVSRRGEASPRIACSGPRAGISRHEQ